MEISGHFGTENYNLCKYCQFIAEYCGDVHERNRNFEKYVNWRKMNKSDKI